MGHTQSALTDLQEIGAGIPHQNVPNAPMFNLVFMDEDEERFCALLGQFLNLLHNWERLKPVCAFKVYPVTITMYQLQLRLQ